MQRAGGCLVTDQRGPVRQPDPDTLPCALRHTLGNWTPYLVDEYVGSLYFHMSEVSELCCAGVAPSNLHCAQWWVGVFRVCPARTIWVHARGCGMVDAEGGGQLVCSWVRGLRSYVVGNSSCSRIRTPPSH